MLAIWKGRNLRILLARHATWCVVWMAVATAAQCPLRADVPRVGLELVPKSPSFGAIKAALKENPTLEVEVHNRSDVAFDLRDVQIGCGCMEAEVGNPGPIAAGESGTVRVTLNRHRIRLGPASYPLTVLDTAGNPVASIPVTYDYDPAVYADHTDLFIDAEEIATNAASAATVVRVRRPGTGKNDIRVECDNEHFVAELASPASSDPEAYPLKVTCAREGPPIGNASATISVYLANAAEPELTIPLKCTVQAPVRAHPPVLVLKPLRAGEEVTRTVRLSSCRPFKLGSVTASSADVILKEVRSTDDELEADEPLVERTFQLVIRASDAAGIVGTVDAELRVEVESPTAFQLVVPIVGEVTAE